MSPAVMVVGDRSCECRPWCKECGGYDGVLFVQSKGGALVLQEFNQSKHHLSCGPRTGIRFGGRDEGVRLIVLDGDALHGPSQDDGEKPARSRSQTNCVVVLSGRPYQA